MYYGRSATYSVDRSLAGRPANLGRSWYFVPASDGRGVWLARVDGHRLLNGLREVTVSGRVVVPEAHRPPTGNLVSATANGPVIQTSGGKLEVWNPRTGTAVRVLDGAFPVATHGNLIAWCRQRCTAIELTRLGDGPTRTIHPPVGVRFVATYDGAFSSEGSMLATEVTDRSGSPRVGIVDIRTGRVAVIRKQRLAPYWSLAWGPSGATLFINPGRGRVASYRPATGRVTLLPFRLHGAFTDMVALDAPPPRS